MPTLRPSNPRELLRLMFLLRYFRRSRCNWLRFVSRARHRLAGLTESPSLLAQAAAKPELSLRLQQRCKSAL